jgi:hypothetical protein
LLSFNAQAGVLNPGGGGSKDSHAVFILEEKATGCKGQAHTVENQISQTAAQATVQVG